jgi:predicted RNase H-like nuclease (RuvC/YqgF family)
MGMYDMYRKKKPKVVDPNAPPRPNLLNHEKRLKDTTITVDQLQAQNSEMKRRIDELERKITNQSAYMAQLHNVVNKLLHS